VNPFLYLQGKASKISKLDPGRPARRYERRAKEAHEQQMDEMSRQEMMEQARIAEEEDRIKRKRARMLTGGRSLLIGTSPMGASSEIGGGGMYG